MTITVTVEELTSYTIGTKLWAEAHAAVVARKVISASQNFPGGMRTHEFEAAFKAAQREFEAKHPFPILIPPL
jgi:hypothetical protein